MGRWRYFRSRPSCRSHSSRVAEARSSRTRFRARHACANADGADVDVAVEDEPALKAGVGIAAADELGHGTIEARLGRYRQAATDGGAMPRHTLLSQSADLCS